MKNIFIGMFIAIAALFGGLYYQQNHKATQAATDLATLQKQFDDLKSNIADKEATAAKLQNDLRKTQIEAANNAGEAAHLQVALTNRVAAEAAVVKTNAKPANAFADLFKNPEMRDMIKKQQSTVFSTMIDKSYADFFAALQLTPDQSAAMKELLTKKMLVDADMGMQIMTGDLTADQRSAIVSQSKTDKDAVDAELKTFLGADNFTALQTYEKTIPDRTAISQFKDALTSGTALNANQEQQMLQVVSQERQAFKFTTDFTDNSKFTGDFSSYFSDDKLNTFFDEQNQLNQRYLTRAQGILTPDQLTSYQKFLNSQQELQKAGMKMAAQMFGPK